MNKPKFRLEDIEGGEEIARVNGSHNFISHKHGEEETFWRRNSCTCNPECRYEGCSGVDCKGNPKECSCEGHCSPYCSCDSQCSHCDCVKYVSTCPCDRHCSIMNDS